MIQLQGKAVNIGHFPDGTLLLKENIQDTDKNTPVVITWKFENNEELLALYFLTKHIKTAGYENILLDMPYIPNARQDRVKEAEDVFTLKYFAQLLNSLGFAKVRVLDAHSNVSLALIDRVENQSPQPYIQQVITAIQKERGKSPLLFYPDEGAKKRYGSMIPEPYCFGMKERDWGSGKIKNLTLLGEKDSIQGRDILMVDDICSYGGTFLFSAEKLKEAGAENIYLYVSHCEENIFQGELLESGYITRIYTTDSIFRKDHKDITVVRKK
ncbi:MAG: ribose-phosphate pyrophosphokinase-like domain-containing protein [Lachnospiraceae bacterium]|nr:ribose-phosphate pyrophosphokinase-like domain-containing protein [Lachnospiraceae bacterium]